LNQESSRDHLAFQVARTTISPNYQGEEFETLDRQILVVSVDVPPRDGETDAQRQECENANAARAVQRQQEIAAAAPGAGLQPANTRQVNANTGLVNDNAGQVNPNARQANANTREQALVAPAAPQQRHQDDPPRANRLRARDLLRDFERDRLEVYNSPQTNLGAALPALNHLEDSPMIRRLQPTSTSQPPKSKKEVLDTADPQQVPTPEAEADPSVLANDVVARVPSTWWLKKDEAKTK
jgi:hypothetical protein